LALSTAIVGWHCHSVPESVLIWTSLCQVDLAVPFVGPDDVDLGAVHRYVGLDLPLGSGICAQFHLGLPGGSVVVSILDVWIPIFPVCPHHVDLVAVDCDRRMELPFGCCVGAYLLFGLPAAYGAPVVYVPISVSFVIPYNVDNIAVHSD
jgi:hypothetical protein